MTEQKPATMRGLARVTFRANLALIRTELEQGWTAKAIFERHHATLGAMSYRQFCRYVADELARAPPSWMTAAISFPRSSPVGLPVPADPGRVASPPTVKPALPASSPEGPAHAGHQQPARTFEHDPIERPGDYERLFGEPRDPKKR